MIAELLLSPLGVVLIVLTFVAAVVVDHIERHHT